MDLRVDAVIRQRGITEREAADEIGVTQPTVNHIRSGLIPSLGVYMAIREWLAQPHNRAALRRWGPVD